MSPEASAPYSDSLMYKSALLRRAVFTGIGMTGIPWMMRHTVQRNRATMILFHEIGPELFREQAMALGKRYNIIPLRQLLRCLRGEARLPPRALVITFDDGHASNRALLPAIRELGVPVSIFLCSGLVGTSRRFWWSAVPSKQEIQRLQLLPNRERLAVLRDQHGLQEEGEAAARAALSGSEVVEMMGAVDFQSHTRTHPILTSCDDAEAEAEIAGSKLDLASRYGVQANALAYPDGYYGDREVRLLRASGYECGLTLDPGYVKQGSDPYRLPRFCLSDDGGGAELMVKASGLWAFARLLLNRARGGAQGQ